MTRRCNGVRQQSSHRLRRLVTRLSASFVVVVGLVAPLSATEESVNQLRPAPQARESCNDTTFLRRITLDTIGRLPTTEEIEAFLADTSPQRRHRVIDRLLNDPRHASLWATQWCEWTKCTAADMEGPEELKPKRAKMWHDWFRQRIASGMPYDQMVRGVICGTSAGNFDYNAWLDQEVSRIRAARQGFEIEYADREFLDLYWRRRSETGEYPRQRIAEITASAFLGIQVSCAKCHQHPFDRWTQADYYGFVNVFAQVQFGSSTELNRTVLQRLQQRRDDPSSGEPSLPRVAEVFNDVTSARPFADPNTGRIVAPRPLGGRQLTDAMDPRNEFMDWLVGEGREQFAANYVNRVWAHHFGTGLVEPVDGFAQHNPPENPRLLRWLTEQFLRSGYDMRYLQRLILNSAAYQSPRPFSRPMPAEIAVSVLHQALGVDPDFHDELTPGADVIEFSGDHTSDASVGRLLKIFGRQPRRSVCDCDRQTKPSLRQSLFQMASPWIMQAIQEGKLLEELANAPDPEVTAEVLYMTMFARQPTSSECKIVMSHLASNERREDALIDLVWTLANASEFLTIP